jgi:hypothetical protein
MITRDQVHICQKYYERILNEVDVDNFTNQSLNRQFDRKGNEEDYKKIERIVNIAQKSINLYPVKLQVIFEQYVYADPWIREKYKNRSISKVLNREPTDFFPDPISICNNVLDE